jgi:hypothetical protein
MRGQDDGGDDVEIHFFCTRDAERPA